jgi:hypothetical protein
MRPSVYRLLGLYAVGLCVAVYWAAVAYRLVHRVVAAAAIPAFIIVATMCVSFETFRFVARLKQGKPSGFGIFCFILSRFSIAYAVILVVGGTIEHYVGGSWGYLFDWYGFVFAGTYALGITAALTHHFALEEDLKHPKPVDPEEDARKHRKYMNPYI